MSPTRLMRGAAPFFYPGGEIGCVVLHGFTGSPQGVRWLGQYLSGQGYTVYGPRLAGHGVRPADLQGITWQEWVADALAAYHLLRDRCRAVFAVGLSMGATLSLMLAANEEVAGVAGLATPYFIYRTWRRPFLKAAALLGMSLDKPEAQDESRLDQIVRAGQQARSEPVTGRVSYPDYPAWAVDQLWSLLDATRAILPQVTAPALLVHSERDNVVPLDHLDKIFAALGSADKQRLILRDSGHVITEDVEREVVFEAVGDFIAARVG